ncbi:MAG: hypothetical protein JKY67_18845 [Pseudomonadales bacterium]|nr:hypothetical protein [Pseudomonadales bacterium]
MKKAKGPSKTGISVIPQFMQDIRRVLKTRPETFVLEFVAPMAVFLCTDAASNVTGRDFIVGAGEISLVSLPGKQQSIFSDEIWTQDHLERIVPQTLGAGLENPYFK